MITTQFNPKETKIIEQTIQCLIATGTFSNFIKNQTMGDCETITKKTQILLYAFGMKNVRRICGTLNYPYTIISVDGYTCTDVTHWWLTIDNRILEFSKGTIIDIQAKVNQFDYVDLTTIDPDNKFEYIE